MDKNIANKIALLVGNVCVGYKGSLPECTPASSKARLSEFLESIEVPVVSDEVEKSSSNTDLQISDHEKRITELKDHIKESNDNIVEIKSQMSNTEKEFKSALNGLKEEIGKLEKSNKSDDTESGHAAELLKRVETLETMFAEFDKSDIESTIHEAVESQLKNFIPSKPEVSVKVYHGVEYDDKSGKNIIATYSRAKVPEFKHAGDSGADAYVCFDDNTNPETYIGVAPGTVVKVPLGISCDIPEGYEIQLRPRSGSTGEGHIAVFGTIDSKYKGVIKANIANISTDPFMINEGDRLCQLVLKPIENVKYTMTEGKIDVNTERGTKGFGSSGKRN